MLFPDHEADAGIFSERDTNPFCVRKKQIRLHTAIPIQEREDMIMNRVKGEIV
jgi:hypothetical protein